MAVQNTNSCRIGVITSHTNSTATVEARNASFRATNTSAIDELQSLGAGSADGNISCKAAGTTDDTASAD